MGGRLCPTTVREGSFRSLCHPDFANLLSKSMILVVCEKSLILIAFRGTFKIFVFFNLSRFSQTVNGKATIGSRCVVNGIKKVAAAPLSGVVIGPTKPARAIPKSGEMPSGENPKHQGRGEARCSFSRSNKAAS